MKYLPKEQNLPTMLNQAGDGVGIYDNLQQSQILFVMFSNYNISDVRSDAQLSSTETRYQKCSQSGKNGSKHPMLSISMAYNVISSKKKTKETLKKSKSLILLCKFGSQAQK